MSDRQLDLMELPTAATTVPGPEAAMVGMGWRERGAPMLALDTETTGTDPLTARVVTCSVVQMLGPTVQQRWGWVVDAGVPVPDEAAAVHGWTTERLRATQGAVTPGRWLAELVEVLGPWLRGRVPLVVFNAPYDLTLLREEACREGGGWPRNGYVLDPLVLDRRLDKYRRGPRTLGTLVQVYGITSEALVGGAHDASYDAVAAGLLAYRLTAAMREDVETLHARQREWYEEWRVEVNEHWRRKGLGRFAPPGWPYRNVTPRDSSYRADREG